MPRLSGRPKELASKTSVPQIPMVQLPPSPLVPVPPEQTFDILRSILLCVEFKIVSYTKWAADIKENHLHTILSGFYVGGTPDTDTFDVFLSQLWLSDKDNLSTRCILLRESLKSLNKKDRNPSALTSGMTSTCCRN